LVGDPFNLESKGLGFVNANFFHRGVSGSFGGTRVHTVDDKLFMASQDPAMVDEDERLEWLNIETKLWYVRMVEIDVIRAAYKSQILTYISHILTDKLTAR
jgi:hypothetical protein